MSLSDVLSSITWPNISDPVEGISPIGSSDPLRGQLEGMITSIYNGSPTGAAILEAAAAAGHLNFLKSSGGNVQATSNGMKLIGWDATQVSTLYYFNDKGRLVQEKPELTLIHEIIHTTGLNDPLPPKQAPTNPQMSSAFDFDGDVVRKQNDVALELGYTDNIQKNYYADAPSDTGRFKRFDQSVSYSQGRTVDAPVIPENEGAGNDTLNLTSSFIANSVDIIFGLDGDDNLNGGGGSDYLYGGEDDDTFIGSDGDDLFHGGGTRDSAGAAVALDDDGIDTADYSAAAAGEFIKITTDVTVNSFHSNAIDAAHRLLIQQTGTGKGTATIVSVEKVKGTAGVDTFEVTQLVAAQLAGSDGKGGLAEVDLAGNDRPSLEGDLIDATRMTDKLVIDLDPAAGFIQVEGDAERKVTVLGAERAWGGENDDTIKGNDEANELKGGAGDDTLAGGNGDDILYGGPGDDQIWGGALNAGASAADGIDEVRYDNRVSIKLSATAGSELTASSQGTDTLHSIERITGSASFDQIIIEALSSNILSRLEWIDLGENPAGSGDRVVWESLTEGARVDLAAGRFDLISGSSSGLSFRNIEDASGGRGNDIIIGSDAANVLFGGLGDDEIHGGAGDDIIGAKFFGDDRLWGGTGDDQFSVSNGDTIYDIDAGDSIDYRGEWLTGGVGIGPDELGRERYFNYYNNQTLWDTIYYWVPSSSTLYVNGLTIYDFQNGDGGIFLGTVGTTDDDSLGGGSENDTLSGLGGNDILTGGGGDDVLDGGPGDDRLEGGAGIDRSYGGTGADLHIVDDPDDLAYEAIGEGADVVRTTVSYNLLAGQEIEILAALDEAGTAPLQLGGNAFDNELIGNAGDNYLSGASGADVMRGLGGDDFYVVENAGDQVFESVGGGTDQIATWISYNLAAGQEIETLSTAWHGGTSAIDLGGNAFANHLIGNNGANYLSGASGADVMTGLGGDDRYVVENSGDQVIEAVGGGNDTVSTWIGYTLAAGQEVETLSTATHAGTAAIDLVGNEFGQTIYGNFGVNWLDGKGGADMLIGFAGADTFAFTTALGGGNVDTVADFEAGVDKIALDDAVFTALSAGALAAGAFRIGTAAQDADDRIIYDSATGALFYDADGDGAGAAVQFATLQAGLTTLSASDFMVI